jgi:hypothetical protein
MDKKIKCGLFVGAAVVAFFVYKNWSKKIRKQIEEQEKQENKELESLGVSTEKLNEEIDLEDHGNMVKALAVGTLFNPEWDYSLIDPEEALKTTNPLISISQEVFNVRGNEVTDLVFYFDIPDYTKNTGDWKKPRLVDYMNGIKAAAEKAWSDIVRFCPKPRCWLVGMVVVSYRDKEGFLTSERVELDDPSVYESLKDETHKDGYGLGAMYEGFKNRNLPDEVNHNLVSWIIKRWSEPLPEFEFVEFHLAYRVAFNMQTHTTALGINIKTGLETLDYFLNNIEIKKGGLVDEEDVKKPLYQNTLFCAPSARQKAKFDLCYYYFINKDNKLEVDSFSY